MSPTPSASPAPQLSATWPPWSRSGRPRSGCGTAAPAAPSTCTGGVPLPHEPGRTSSGRRDCTRRSPHSSTTVRGRRRRRAAGSGLGGDEVVPSDDARHPLAEAPEGTMARATVGRLLLTAAVLGSGIGHAVADLNRTHVFNPRWMPHARFHTASAVGTELGWSAVSLWLLRRPGSRDAHELALKVAALYPILSYAPFFIAEALPGSEAEDEPGELPRVAGVPVNLVIAGVVPGLSMLGYLLARAGDRAPR